MEVNIRYTGYEGCPVIELPPSKSMAARTLMLAGYQGLPLPDYGDESCEDVTVLRTALSSALSSDSGDADIYIGSSGTAMRFMLAFLSQRRNGCRRVILRGTEQVQSRPVGKLVDTLRGIGAEIEYMAEEGHLPVMIRPQELKVEGVTEVDTTDSSQYMSAMMLLGSALEGGIRLKMTGGRVSQTYILMTAETLQRAGVEVSFIDSVIEVNPSRQGLLIPETEGDWSSAGYFYEAIALADAGKQLILRGLKPYGESLQGDSRVQRIYEPLGVTTEVTDEGLLLTKHKRRYPESFDELLKNIPDAVPALAATLCGLNISFDFTGLGHLRHKESNRLQTLSTELNTIGYQVYDSEEGLNYCGWMRRPRRNRVVSSHDDHRIAMAMAVLAVVTPMRIVSAEAVEKSFPAFYRELAKIGYEVSDKEKES